jgi:hypothetical protein
MILLVVVILVATTAPAATLDLSQPSGSSLKEQAAAGQKFTVDIINMVPGTAYQVSFQIEPVIPPVLPSGNDAAKMKIMMTTGRAADCASVLTDYPDSLKSATTEKLVAAANRDARDKLDKVGNCTAGDKLQLEALIAQYTTHSHSFSLGEGEELTVTVSRDADKDKKPWTLVVSTGSAGSFFAMYGFNFMQANDDRFFLKPKEIVTTPANTATNTPEQKATVYTITKQHNRLRQVFSPAVMFTWSSRARLLGKVSSWSPVPIAGLGFDGSDPNVFAGVAFIYHTNLALNVGVGMTKVKKLVGSLTPNTDVKDQLTDAQLYESTYKPRLFFGVSFRFGENPLKPKETPK